MGTTALPLYVLVCATITNKKKCRIEGGTVELLVPPTGASIGERILFAGHSGEPDVVLNEKTGKAPLEIIKPFFITDSSRIATYKGTPFMTSAGPVVSETNSN